VCDVRVSLSVVIERERATNALLRHDRTVVVEVGVGVGDGWGIEPVPSPTYEVHADHVAPARCKGDLPLQNEIPLETRRARANGFQNVATQFGGGSAGFAAAATEHRTKKPKAIWILRSSTIALLRDFKLVWKRRQVSNDVHFPSVFFVKFT
jgi:hypothetical protein